MSASGMELPYLLRYARDAGRGYREQAAAGETFVQAVAVEQVVVQFEPGDAADRGDRDQDKRFWKSAWGNGRKLCNFSSLAESGQPEQCRAE